MNYGRVDIESQTLSTEKYHKYETKIENAAWGIKIMLKILKVFCLDFSFFLSRSTFFLSQGTSTSGVKK